MKIHSFLEKWGIINYSVDPTTRPIHPLQPKSFNYKTPVYVDASSYNVKGNVNVLIIETTPNMGSKIGENCVVLINNEGEELRTIYPITNTPENLFRSVFNKNSMSPLNQLNFLAKNYRPKCDMCSNLCGLDFYVHKDENNNLFKTVLLICEDCLKNSNFPKDLSSDNFEITNVLNIANLNRGKLVLK